MAALGAANGAVGPDWEFQPFVAARLALSRGAIPGDITSIASLGSSLFVGTSKGKIVRVDFRSPDPTAAPPETLSPTRVCPEVTVASGYAVTHLIVITRRRLLLAVAGGTLALFEPGDDAPVLRYTNSSLKASQASVDERPSGEVMVAVVCPGQVKLLRLEGFAFTERCDLSTPGKLASLVLVGEQVALAYVKPLREYNIIHTADLGAVKTVELIAEKRGPPVVARTGPDEVVYTTAHGGSSRGAAESMGIFLTRSGEPAHRPPITWASAPAHVVVCAPYVLGVTADEGDVHVHWHSLPTAAGQQGGPSGQDVGRLMQRIPLRLQPVAACDASAGCLGRLDGRNPVFIAGSREFDAALRHLCLSGMDPRELTSLFPGALHPAGFSFASSVLTPDLLAGVVDGTRTPAAAAEAPGDGDGDLVPFAVSSAGGGGAVGMEAVIRAVREQQRAAAAAGGYAAGGRGTRRDRQPMWLKDTWGAVEMAAVQRRAAAGRGRKHADSADAGTVSDTSLLRDAMTMVSEFLLQRRQLREPAWDSARAREALDSSLCRALALTGRVAELCAVLARESDVNLEDATAFLGKQGLRHALALLLRTRGAHGDALAEWERVASASTADRTAAKLLGGGWLKGLVPPDSGLDVAAERLALACTFETLRTADDVDALRRGLGWVLERSPITALSVVCTPRRVSLPAVELLSLLQQAQSERSLARRHPELLFRSLPHRLLLHLVFVVGSRDQFLHTALATDLAEAVLRCRGETPGGQQRGGSAAAAAANSAAAAGLRATAAAARGGASASQAAAAGLRTLEGTTGSSGRRAAPGEEEGIAGELRRDLLQLLRWSRFYDPRKLSAVVAGTTLEEERVLLHGRAGEHGAALRICLVEMGDLPRAEAYCVEAFAASSGGRDGDTAAEAATLGRHARHNPFLVLFTLLLDGLPGTGPMRHEALGLMERHAGSVAVRQALDVLPADIPVAKMRRLLRRMIPSAETRWRQARVAQQVAELDRLETNVALTRAQQHYAAVDRDTVCAESGQRVQSQPFVLRAPPSAHVLAESKLVLPVLQSAIAKRR